MACDLRGISLRWVRGLAIFGRSRQWAAIDPEDSSGGTESLEGRPISLFSRKKETSVIAGSALLIGSLGMAPMAHAQGGTTTIGAGAIAIIGSVGSAAIGSSSLGSSSLGSSSLGSSAVGSVGSASIGSAAVGSLGSATVGSSDSAPEVPIG